MRATDFPSCCGAIIYHAFGCTDMAAFSPDEDAESPEDFRDFLKKQAKIHKSLGFQLVILNSDQYKLWHTIMEELGFKLLDTSINGLHNSRLYLYSISRLPKKEK